MSILGSQPFNTAMIPLHGYQIYRPDVQTVFATNNTLFMALDVQSDCNVYVITVWLLP